MTVQTPAPAPPGEPPSSARVAWLLSVDGLARPRGIVEALAGEGTAELLRERYLAWTSSLRVENSSAKMLAEHLLGRPHEGLALAEAFGLRAGGLLGVHESLGTVAIRTVALAQHDGTKVHAVAKALLQAATYEDLVEAQRCLLQRAAGAPTLFDVWPERGPNTILEVWRREVGVPPPQAAPLSAPRWIVHGAVDRLGLLLVRATLGPAAPEAVRWLPSQLSELSGEPLPRLRLDCSPELLPAWALDTEVAAYLPLLKEDTSKADVCRQAFALALARWREVATRVFRLIGEQARPRPLRVLARTWLSRERPGAPPSSRFRLPSGPASGASQGEPGTFQLDPVASLNDCELLRTTWLGTSRTFELGTWIINEWPEARDLVRALAIGAGADGEARRGVVWVHHALFDPEGTRELSAFKKSVSVAGRAAWCLTELDEAVVATCPPNTPSRDWWTMCAARVRGLPKEAWAASLTWLDGVRSLRFLNDVFQEDRR